MKCEPCRSKTSTVTQFSKKDGVTDTVEVIDLQQEIIDGITWIESKEPCTECDKVFMRPKKRGRPPTKCPDCLAWADAEKAAEVTTSDEKLEELFSGDKELLKGTPDSLPKGAESQCPSPPPSGANGCGRIFTSDSACESHKVYGPDGSLQKCKDPASLGMEPRTRRNIPIWTRPREMV